MVACVSLFTKEIICTADVSGSLPNTGVCTETKLQVWDLKKIVIFDFQSVS